MPWASFVAQGPGLVEPNATTDFLKKGTTRTAASRVQNSASTGLMVWVGVWVLERGGL
jgi:hypothetical protein